ncbi:uncharacterized protein LOC142324008 [Lycorma delicatula]|uniref:uncharacterized protein LOC142324008 n=1 Tax=Lycorma delicatula TaxID=130591 RepID=UPI003F5195B8
MNSMKIVRFSDVLQKSGFIGVKSGNYGFLKRTFVSYIYTNKSLSSSILDVNRITKLNINCCGNVYMNRNVYSVSKVYSTTAKDANVEATPPLTKENAHALVMRLTTEERAALMTVLQEFESEQLKAEYKGQLAAFRWRSKFGRPSKLPRLGDVDPTGSYCPVPEDWLLRKYAETIPKPNTNQLFGVAIHNASPFIGFGFLDNFFMIICGDYIELYVGSVITISTMAAAALGNTLSDILGIGSAFYVERAVSKIGFRPPNLSPIQLDMPSSRRAANLGRVIGVTIGCLLGMFPLLFKKEKEEESAAKAAAAVAAIAEDGLAKEISSGQQGTSISVI